MGGGDIRKLQLSVLERKESAPVLSILPCSLSAHSLPCTPNRGKDMSSNTLTTVVRYTNQINTVTASNTVEHSGDSVTCSHTHNYTETHECQLY